MPSSRLLKTAGHIIGALLCCGAIILLGSRIKANWHSLISLHLPLPPALVVALGAVAYCAVSFLLSLAWIQLLRQLYHQNVSSAEWHRIYARTQIGKYVPGNIFHFAGRHIQGRRVGASHTAMTGAAIFEAAGLIFSACTISLTGLSFSPPTSRGYSVVWYLALLMVALALPFFIHYIIKKISAGGVTTSTRGLLRSLCGIYTRYILFFFFSGLILLAVFHLVAGWKGIPAAGTVICIYATSWIAGFVVPGSPAGLGIRESLMVVALGSMIGETQSLEVTLLFRLITTGGDFFFFMTSFLGREADYPQEVKSL